jgi:Tol biopolymer transport system component
MENRSIMACAQTLKHTRLESLTRLIRVATILPWLASPLSALPAAAADSLDDAVAQLKSEVRGKGWIIFGARSTAGDWDLFVCRPDGSDLRPLTRTPEYGEFSPQWSRDGRQLLYRRVKRDEVLDNNRHGEQGELVLAQADGSSPVVLGKPGELSWASFSPDGTQIASLSMKGIAFVDLASRKALRTLPRKGFFQQVTWSPDGKWLIGVANSFGASWSIARMDAITGEATAVNTVDCCTPDWFPDSAEVIFSWRPPGQKINNGYGWTQLWRATADGKKRQLVYGEDGRHVYGGNVSPDGQYALFTGNMNEDGDPKNAGGPMGLIRLKDAPIICGESKALRAVHPDTAPGPVLVLPAGWEPFWSYDAAVDPHGRGHSNDRDAESGEKTTEQSTRDTSQVKEPAADLGRELHDLGWIVFSAKTESGDWDIFTIRPDGSGRRQVTSTREFNEAGARFSPDGKRILYYRIPVSEPPDNNTYGTFDLVIANADGSAAEVYGRDYPWASWGPDGRKIACLSPRGIQIVDLASRKIVTEFPRKGIVEQLVWSPDGKWFIGTANGLGPFWNIGLLKPETGEITPVSETDRYNCTPDWCPDSQHIVYARGIIPEKGGHAELWVAGLTGERRRIYSEPGRHIYGACASPDGRHVLFTRSIEDLGKVNETLMAIIRWPDGSAAAVSHPHNGDRMDLGPGWEPHWIANRRAQGS